MELNALQLGKYISVEKIVEETGFEITQKAKEIIASCSFGTPRIAIKYAKKCRSYAIAEGRDRIDEFIVESYMRMINVDENGLTPLHRKSLKVLLEYYPKEASTNAIMERMNVAGAKLRIYIFLILHLKAMLKDLIDRGGWQQKKE